MITAKATKALKMEETTVQLVEWAEGKAAVKVSGKESNSDRSQISDQEFTSCIVFPSFLKATMVIFVSKFFCVLLWAEFAEYQRQDEIAAIGRNRWGEILQMPFLCE